MGTLEVIIETTHFSRATSARGLNCDPLAIALLDMFPEYDVRTHYSCIILGDKYYNFPWGEYLIDYYNKGPIFLPPKHPRSLLNIDILIRRAKEGEKITPIRIFLDEVKKPNYIRKKPNYVRQKTTRAS